MLQELAELITTSAQDEILPRFERSGLEVKADGTLLTEADTSMQKRMQAALQTSWPDIGFLGEEMSAQEQQRQFSESANGIWVLDPLDGTSNFASSIPYFSVSLALIRDNQVQLGLVYDPTRDELFSAARGQGAWLNGQPLTVSSAVLPLSKGIGLVDFKRLDKPLARRLAEQPPYASQRSFGSVALDWCWITAGRGHVYLHGKQKLWDFAAGCLILEEAGGRSCTLEGEPVFNQKLEPRSAVAAADTQVFAEWCEWLGIK
jgi:myo-inositol-1(or 4)-monophosphatase